MKSKNSFFKLIFALVFLATMGIACSSAETETSEMEATETAEPMEMEEPTESLPAIDTTAKTRPETAPSPI